MAAITLISASLVTQASLLSVKCPTSVFYKDTCRWMKSLPGKANTLNFTSAKIPLPNNHMLWELGHIARENPSSKSGFYWTLQIPAPPCKQPAISFAPQGLCSLLYLPNIPFTLVLPTKLMHLPRLSSSITSFMKCVLSHLITHCHCSLTTVTLLYSYVFYHINILELISNYAFTHPL